MRNELGIAPVELELTRVIAPEPAPDPLVKPEKSTAPLQPPKGWEPLKPYEIAL